MKATVEEIQEVVANNDKKRYQITTEVNKEGVEVMWIRAVQGHTLGVISEEDLMKPILDPF